MPEDGTDERSERKVVGRLATAMEGGDGRVPACRDDVEIEPGDDISGDERPHDLPSSGNQRAHDGGPPHGHHRVCGQSPPETRPPE